MLFENPDIDGVQYSQSTVRIGSGAHTNDATWTSYLILESPLGSQMGVHKPWRELVGIGRGLPASRRCSLGLIRQERAYIHVLLSLLAVEIQLKQEQTSKLYLSSPRDDEPLGTSRRLLASAALMIPFSLESNLLAILQTRSIRYWFPLRVRSERYSLCQNSLVLLSMDTNQNTF